MIVLELIFAGAIGTLAYMGVKVIVKAAELYRRERDQAERDDPLAEEPPSEPWGTPPRR